MIKKWICLALALALWCAPLSGAFAEDALVSEPAEEQVKTAAETDLTENGEPLPSVEGEPQQVSEQPVAPSDMASDAVEYACVIVEQAPVYAAPETQDALAVLFQGGAALIVERSEEWLRVAFNSERGLVDGYIDAKLAEIMSPDALSLLMSEITSAEIITFYEDDLNRPLTTPYCVFPDVPGQPAEGETEQQPEQPAEGETEQQPEDQAVMAPEEPLDDVQADDPENGATDTQDNAVMAQPEATDIQLSATSIAIGLKEEYSLLTATLVPEDSEGTITWSSSKPKVASVDADTGVITGVSKGSAVIYAQTETGIQKSCKVVVRNAPDKLALAVKDVNISIGQSYQLVPKMDSDVASAVTYTSSNTSVATVDAFGVVTGHRMGFSTITARTFNGKTAKCTVAVLAEPAQVFLPDSLTIVMAEHRKIEPSVVDANGAKTFASYTFYADDGTGSVTIDPNTGEAVGMKVGTATVRVTTHNGISTYRSGGDQVVTVCRINVVEGPTRVAFAESAITIGQQQSYQLVPRLLKDDGTEMEGQYTVTSSEPRKLKVNSKGVLTGVTKGTYTVTVKASNGVTGSITVKVVKAPSKVTIKPAKPVIGVGQSMTLKTTFPSGSMGSCTFSSSAKKVVSVNKKGVIKGLKEGTAVITAKTHNGKTNKVTVTVTKGLGFVSLNADYTMVYDPLTDTYTTLYTKTLAPGKTFQITFEKEYKAYGDVLGYSSDDENIAQVTGTGLVTAKSPGTAIITVSLTGGAVTKLKVMVSGNLPASLSFTAGNVTLQAGKATAVPGVRGENMSAATLAAINYISSDENIFTVSWSDENAQWEIKGINPGSATLMGMAGGTVAQLPVTVTAVAEPAEIHFEDSLAILNIGDTFAPRVMDEYENGVTATLTSGNPGIVTVAEDGALKALSEGETSITAQWQALSASMTVRVLATQVTVTLDADSLKLGVGQRHALKVQVNGEKASSNLSFASSDKSVASVTAAGMVIAHSPGTADITVTASSGAVATCKVTVGPVPTSLSIVPAELIGRPSDAGAQLTVAFGAPDETGTVTFRSSNADVADVNDDGYVTFRSQGVTEVIATTNNGLSVAIPVTVLPNKAVSSAPSYRFFAAYSYFDKSYDGYLPFTKNNAKSMASTFAKSSVGSLSYSTKVLGNPSKTQLLSGISGFFSGTGDNDISIIYLCSHGHMTNGYSGYRMSLPGYSDYPENPNYYMTSQEIMNCVSRINGNVVLILDSCYSGAFLQDMSGRLDAMGGRIAVITAASDTRATYYKVKDTNASVDFFSFFLMQGLGYNAQKGWWAKNAKGEKGKYPGYLAADKTGNGDGIVTLGEFFDYGSKCIAANIPNYMKKSWYWGDKSRVQVPRFYAGNLNNLVIYQPKK